MARQKSNLCTHSKSVTLEGASTKHVDEEMNQEMHEASTQDNMKELLAEPSNQLQSFDTSGSIAWALDDVFAKVMGKKRKCRICGVGFGPSPSARSSKCALTNLQMQSSQSRDDEVAQLKASLAEMQKKLSSFDKMKERLSQFEEMEQRMAHMLQQMQQELHNAFRTFLRSYNPQLSKNHQSHSH